MRRSATGGNPGERGFENSFTECDPSGIPGHEGAPVEMRHLSMLLVEDDPKEKEKILSSMRKCPTEVRCVSTITAAFHLIEKNWFAAIMIDRHLGGWVSAQTCRDLVVRAGDIPVVGLINEDCVLGLQDGIEAGLTGVYYKDQMSIYLMRRLGRLANLPGGYRLPAHASARRSGATRMSRPRARP